MATLPFSEPFLSAEFIERPRDIVLAHPTIVFNASPTTVLLIGNETLAPSKSGIFTATTILDGEAAVLITAKTNLSAIERSHPFRERMMHGWKHVHDIFPLPHLVETQLWRSAQEQVGNLRLNLWFAAAGTDCGIHNKHDFLEVHTQVWGTGHMQKFHENDERTLYSDIFMTPGYTHAPFCGEEDHRYPWHRYFADTDCVWLAAEYV